jgi:hypothetical protein
MNAHVEIKADPVAEHDVVDILDDVKEAYRAARNLKVRAAEQK